MQPTAARPAPLLPPRFRAAARVFPLVATASLACATVGLRPHIGAWLWCCFGVLLVASWALYPIEPLLLAGLVLVGVGVCLTNGDHSLLPIRYLIAGAVLYLVHAVAALVDLSRSSAFIESRVATRWVAWTLVVLVVGVAAGEAALFVATRARAQTWVGAIAIGVVTLIALTPVLVARIQGASGRRDQ